MGSQVAEKIVFDWNDYRSTARLAVAEGNVLVRNEGQVLPVKEGSVVSVFGRIQSSYYKSGTGSGGMVNVHHVVSILDALLESPEIKINQNLLSIYREWEKENPFEEGVGWGQEPWSQPEMPLSDSVVSDAAKESDIALVIIGRTAGEDRDNSLNPGSLCLSEAEEEMLGKVRGAFSKMAVILNVGNVIQMDFVEKYKPDAVLYAWQGGMEGGYGTADVLLGRVTPSGRLTDSVVYKIEDYPSHKSFGGSERNCYEEDIYVGYRYFQSVAPDKVLYPFGYGLSYTTFSHTVENINTDSAAASVGFDIKIKNTGSVKGKEVAQIYLSAPQGKLGKPAVVLCGFDKTKELMPGEEETISFKINLADFASYDDMGETGNEACYVLEKGEYKIYDGKNAAETEEITSLVLDNLIITERLSHQVMPTMSFERMKMTETADGSLKLEYQKLPKWPCLEKEHRLENMGKEIPMTGDKGYKLSDVLLEKVSMEDFIAQLSKEDLSCIVRGEGMGSPKVTAGTAAAFGGVSESLKNFGIPCGCCSDGPSGMRLDSGRKAFSLPNGTLLACSFNLKLNEELFYYLGREMVYQKVDCLLGPGMNIHRHPLNGRNFEYFSEDPYVTGKTGAAQIRGLKRAGVTGTMKHFAANNQEKRRHYIDSVLSERALREIYLRGYEIAVKEAGADSVMTSYGKINGFYTAGRHDLNTGILRNEWGYKGIVMTDWWANVNDAFDENASHSNLAAMVRSQNDVYMVCPEADRNATGDNTLESLEKGRLNVAELQRCAMNICEFLMKTKAMERLMENPQEVEIINLPKDPDEIDAESIEYYEVSTEGLTIPLNDVDASKGKKFVFGIDALRQGGYEVELTAKSDLGPLAQIPVTLYIQSIPMIVFTFNGTNGEWMTVKKKIIFSQKYQMLKLHFGQSGVELKDIKFTFVKDKLDISVGSEFIEEEKN